MEVPSERSVARPQTEGDALLRGRKLGDFVLYECIGEGAFAAVYRCVQPLLDREAVVKVLHQRLRASEVLLQRFMREARFASRLDHPYAAHVYAFGVEAEDGLAWIAMEMVHGTPLDRWLHEHGPLPLDMLVPFFELVAEVVQNAHDHGIVHRDLKPSNVMMVERAGRIFPKLLDFGIAKLVDDAAQAGMPGGGGAGAAEFELDDTPTSGLSDSGNQSLTQANATLGSPPYMSPEQWCDPLSVGPRSDLYSLAVMAYEALTGAQPFTGPTIPAIGEQHCNAEVPKVGDGFPAALDRVFQRALAKRASDRPANALAFARELRAAAFSHLDTEPSIPQAGQSGSLGAPRAKRKVWLLAIGAAALIAGGGAAFTLLGRASDAHPPKPGDVIARAEPAPPPPASARTSAGVPAAPAPVVAPPPAEARATVVVEIASTPQGAEVFRMPSEIKVGSTPWRAELPSEAGMQVFLVKKSGFADRRVEVDLRTGGTHAVKLPRAIRRPASQAKPEAGRRKGEPVDPFRTTGGS